MTEKQGMKQAAAEGFADISRTMNIGWVEAMAQHWPEEHKRTFGNRTWFRSFVLGMTVMGWAVECYVTFARDNYSLVDIPEMVRKGVALGEDFLGAKAFRELQ